MFSEYYINETQDAALYKKILPKKKQSNDDDFIQKLIFLHLSCVNSQTLIHQQHQNENERAA
jgi:hypothetical protein